MKKTAIFISVLFLYSFCFSQSSKNLKQFIRGNIQDKISSIRNASQEENVSISLMALDFCLQNKAVLEDDRDLDALCLLSLLSLPYNYTDSLSQDEKAEFSEKILEIFNSFSDENVRIAVLNKISSGTLDSPSFVELLNSFLSDDFQNFSQDFYKNLISASGEIGNEQTFKILFEKYRDDSYKSFKSELKESIVKLSDNSVKDITDIISSGNLSDLRFIFETIVQNEKKTQVFRSQIAENILSASIYITEDNSSLNELILLQVEVMKFLAESKWTRGSDTILKFYNLAKNEYTNGIMNTSDFCIVIKAVSETVPIKAVSLFSDYLIELNRQKENDADVQEEIVLALISALGAIGDKNAFDSLLSVTYYDYSDEVINKARSALAGLKW
ncbi:MAG: hypothetical protein MR408_03545 [Spirochaetia bacterium]|nr:hypothetical protein [Spirochaetia bacterium]